MQFGFSYIGLIFLLMLFIPNIFWAKHPPKDYEKYVDNENKTLLALERMGEVMVSGLCLVFSDFNPHGLNFWLLWFALACLLMLLYEVYWLRYFRSEKTLRDMYRSLLGIPVAGATLPVLAFFCLGIYGKNPPLMTATVILGIGHIGIHINHRKEIM